MFCQHSSYIQTEHLFRMTETEIHIIEGLRQRSPKVQQEALEQYGNYVWTQVVRLVTSVEDAEEVYQDVFVKVFGNIKMYDEERSSFRTWLSRIAYNESITFLRRKRQALIYFEDNEGQADALSEAEVEETLGHGNEETVQLISRHPTPSTRRASHHHHVLLRRDEPEGDSIRHGIHTDHRCLQVKQNEKETL